MKRLIEQIRSSSLSNEKIAKRTNLTSQRLEEILLGAEPTVSELHRLAKTLNVSMTVLTNQGDNKIRNSILFRRSVEEKPRYETALYKICELVRLSIKVLPHNKLPPAWLLDYVDEPTSYKTAEAYAIKFRSQFFNSNNFDPLVRLPQILDESCNVIQFMIPGERVEGASLISGGYGFTFLSPRFPARMLYTLAHELGHLIAHHSKALDCIVIDTPSHMASLHPAKDVRERFANAFAGCLLMPQQGLATALRKIRQHTRTKGDDVGEFEILFLSRVFGVSFQVAALRCEQLQLIPAGSTKALYEVLKREFGSPERRAKSLDLPPMAKVKFPLLSTILVKHLRSALLQGSMSAGHVAEILGMPIDRLQDLEASQIH